MQSCVEIGDVHVPFDGEIDFLFAIDAEGCGSVADAPAVEVQGVVGGEAEGKRAAGGVAFGDDDAAVGFGTKLAAGVLQPDGKLEGAVNLNGSLKFSMDFF